MAGKIALSAPIHAMHRRLACLPLFRPAWHAVLLAALLAAGCSSTPTPHGKLPERDMEGKEWGQSDVNRVATLGMQANLQSLYLLMDKLYRRNPQEWKKGGFASRDEATKAVRTAIDSGEPWPELLDQRDIDGMSMSLSPQFAGDRVAAFIYSTAEMLITAHGGRTTFYLIHGLDAQSLYNAARNLEIANWMLTHRTQANGMPLLLTNEISPQGSNLSFEREFGKMIGRVDLLAEVISEKYRRAVIGYVQNLAGGTFLQFLPVQAVAH